VSLADRELTDVLDGIYIVPEDPEEKQRFSVTDKDQAEWAARKRAKLEAQKRENLEVAQRNIARIQGWLAQENSKLDESITFFDGLLEAWHRSILDADPKAKTIKLPSGILQLRQQQPNFIRNDEALLAWCKTNRPEFVAVKESPAWAEIKKIVVVSPDGQVVTQDGEIVAGVVAEERGLAFSVKTEGE
jgi:phage host-nuclease inhibitor protein Gam